MTSFLALFNHEQKIIFDLGNLVNGVYTAAFNVTLTAAFFSADDTIPPADLILPVSARKSVQNMPSVFTVPPGTASNALTLPRNTKRAVFTIAATGQSEEEACISGPSIAQENKREADSHIVLVEQRLAVGCKHVSAVR